MIRTMIVDDERNILEDTARSLEKLSYIEIAGMFTSPVEAVKFANEHPIDAAILDVEMPGMDGISLAALVRAVRPEVQIIFATGYDRYALQAYGIHAIGYLMKPFSFQDLSLSLEQVRIMLQGIRKQNQDTGVEVRTFGKFDIYLDGQALSFPYSKAKEVFAFLVDARGGEVSMEQVITCLWEDRVYDNRVKQLYRKAVSVMRNIFREAGCEEICIYNRSRLAVNTKALTCDYYRFLAGDQESRKTYLGNYMPEYSWAEETNAMLDSLLD